MQEAAFAELGLNWRYLTIEVKPEALPDAIRGVRAFGMQGINSTIRIKSQFCPCWMRSRPMPPDRRRQYSPAEGDRLIGENTDGKGFRGLREEAGVDPQGKRVAIIGAGGAARASPSNWCLPARSTRGSSTGAPTGEKRWCGT